VRLNILTGNIGNKFLIAIFLAIENNTDLTLVFPTTEFPRAEKEAQFKRHVEARQGRRAIAFGARNIMLAILALGDNATDFVQTIFGRVICFQRNTVSSLSE
jgi:hypothetical protein